jgi:chromosomal replication initiation ATPase DnaA
MNEFVQIPMTPADVLFVVAGYYSVTEADLTGKSRDRSIWIARAVAMWMARNHTHCSFPEIGRAFNKHHTTVWSACKMVANNPRLVTDIKALGILVNAKSRCLEVSCSQ